MAKLGNVTVGGKNPVRIMGILNISPESFFKKSIKTSKQEISNSVRKMEMDGADFIDVGGMSTAPYLSTIISEKLEFSRISKAIKIIQNVSNLPISVDTCRASVAKSSLDLGVDIINDISGLRYDEKMIDVISNFNLSIIVSAFSPKPVVAGNHVNLTKNLLKESTEILKKNGFPSNKIIVDPAIGFFRKSGKGPFFTKIKSDWVTRDIQIIQNLDSIKQQYPILISVSNKSFIGKILGKENPSDRLFGSIAAEVISIHNGASVIRTHNVFETKDAIKITSKLLKRNKGL